MIAKEEHGVGALDAWVDVTKALSETSDFQKISTFPQFTFTALGEFFILGQFSSVRVECIAMECPMVWDGFEVGCGGYSVGCFLFCWLFSR